MRAKFILNTIEKCGEFQENLVFNPVCAASFGPNGESEDNDFARYTPCGEIRLTITNPNLIGKFRKGNRFYVDFSCLDAPDAPPAS